MHRGIIAPHYACPPWTAGFAYGALGYAIASVVYLTATRFMGTPFSDSLSDAQRKTKADSACARGVVFGAGVAVAVAVLAAWRPFRHQGPCAGGR